MIRSRPAVFMLDTAKLPEAWGEAVQRRELRRAGYRVPRRLSEFRGAFYAVLGCFVFDLLVAWFLVRWLTS